MTQENVAEEMGTIALLAKQLEAKDKRIKYLEMVLEQRVILTEGSLNGRVIQSEDEALTLFRENPGVGFTYDDAREAFKNRFRYLPKQLDRRMRQLRQDCFLWSNVNEKGDPVYYLKLEELPK